METMVAIKTMCNFTSDLKYIVKTTWECRDGNKTQENAYTSSKQIEHFPINGVQKTLQCRELKWN
jgi:hypothetical protein